MTFNDYLLMSLPVYIPCLSTHEYSVGFLSFDGKIDHSLFKERQLKVVEYFLDVIKRPAKYCSVVGNGSAVYCETSNIRPAFVLTNYVYDLFWDEWRFDQIETFNSQLLSGIYSHVVYLDCFGRIQKVFDSRGEGDFFDKLMLSNKIPGPKSRKTLCLSPFNALNINNSMLRCDQLGFKHADVRAQGNDANSKRIAILGGSFASGIFCIPGESFPELLQDKLNKRPYTTASNSESENIKIICLAQSGIMQADNFTHFILSFQRLGLEGILWIDGLNDLCAGSPLISSLKYNLPVNLETGWIGNDFDLSEYDFHDTILNFIKQRRIYLDVLHSLGIEVLNILQPIDPACISSKRTVAAEALLKHYPAEWLSYDKYKNIHEYVAAYASVEEGINFYHTDAEHDLDFWDIAHLSPAGEAQFSDWLMSLMFKVNFMGIAL